MELFIVEIDSETWSETGGKTGAERENRENRNGKPGQI
jgi:hypothetical protein